MTLDEGVCKTPQTIGEDIFGPEKELWRRSERYEVFLKEARG